MALRACHRGVLAGLAAIGLTAHADEKVNDHSDLPRWVEHQVEPLREDVSEWVEHTSRAIDQFFGTDEAWDVHTDSYLRVSHEWRWFEGRELDPRLNARFRLDLPTAQERLRLIIESELEDERGTLAEQEATLDESDDGLSSVFVGLARLGRHDQREGVNVGFNVGIRARLPPDVYTRMTTQRLWTLNEGPWELHNANRLAWFARDGYLARTRWDLGRPLSDSRHLRYIGQLQWRETEDTLEYQTTVEHNHRLDEWSALRLSWVALASSSSRPRLDNTFLQARYRRDLLGGYLFGDVMPELHFPEDTGYEPRWALTLRLEMYFRRQVTRGFL